MDVLFDYHDAPINSIIINSTEESLVINILVHNEKTDDYDLHSVKFTKVVDLTLPMNVINSLDAVIDSFDIEDNGDGKTAKIMTIFNHGDQSVELKFKFTDVDLQTTT